MAVSAIPRHEGAAGRMSPASDREAQRLYRAIEGDFGRMEVVKDLVDECIDLTLDYRQSGHPGGSRSKVHLLLSLLLSGAMRWDIRRPWLAGSDRLVLAAGHTVPLVYSSLAVLDEALRARFESTGDTRFAFPDDGRWALTWEDLLGFRHRGGLPGHAEMAGKTLLLKFNTGPSGHGMAPAAGQALALEMAGTPDVKVFVVEGEGGLTPGAAHETKNTAWGLGLSNLVFLVDWNDFGIDPRPTSSVVAGTPVEWFEPYGWRVTGTEHGADWGEVTRVVLDAACGSNPRSVPSVGWFKTKKGRGYGKYDYASHGTPWPRHSPEFWDVRKRFMGRYGVEYAGVDQPAPGNVEEARAEQVHNLGVVMGVLRGQPGLVEWLSDRLAAIAASVPGGSDGSSGTPGPRVRDGLTGDPRIFDPRRYPPAMWKSPGEKVANRAALGAWGAYVNSLAKREYGRPLFLACSADLAESTNIAGFAEGFGGDPGFGWYERDTNPDGCLLPTEITEFANAGLMVGLASVNFSRDPFSGFEGFWGACSTYGSFSYLKYGPMRLFSQLAQDSELRVGKVLWVAGHSGPETADDSRTHFGILETGVTQLFPDGQIIDVHPWEYNEVPVVLAAAFACAAPIVALHLTRPAIPVPDRASLGIPSYFSAARGAYVLRPFREDQPEAGTVFVRGTMATANLLEVLADLDRYHLNVKVVAAISPQLFAAQDDAYRQSVVSPGDVFDSMAITNGAYELMHDWVSGPVAKVYSLSSDFDGRWRTGGTVDEVMEEAHLDPAHILAAIERFVGERAQRLEMVARLLDASLQR